MELTDKNTGTASVIKGHDITSTGVENVCVSPSAEYTRHKKRIMSRIVYLLFTSSFVYLIAGPWIGWDGSIQQTLLTAFSTVIIVKWPIKRSILKFAPSRKATKWQVLIYCLIPWRLLSRSWGKIAAIPVPVSARPIVYGVYCKLFGVCTQEMEKPLDHYTNIVDFFTRKLRVDARIIDTCGLLISPCDGTVVQCGPISDKYIKKVKGIDYCIQTFLGLKPGENVKPYRTSLYQCVLYLAPGDYHRFHSPCDWVACQRLHFCGKLLSVAPTVARWLPNLLAINERAVYVGTWEHGFFSYTAVGATNVGSIVVHNDPTLTTNVFRPGCNINHVHFEENFELTKGVEMGLFSMGSTIVLIFEAPDNFHFTCHENDRIKFGNCLGGLDFLSSASPTLQNPLDPEEGSDVDWNEYDINYEFCGSEKVLVS